MLRTLRSQLIASHVALLMIVIPIMGAALVYVLETRVILVSLVRQLNAQAVLVAEMTRDHPDVWVDMNAADAFVDRVGPLFPAQLMLLSPEGRVLASSDPADAPLIGQSSGQAGLDSVLRGLTYTHMDYSQNWRAEVADVMVPGMAQDGRVSGVVRLTDQFANVFERFLRLRWLIGEVLAVGLLLGSIAGLILAWRVERPLARVTLAVESLTVGHVLAPLAEEGPEETRLLLRAVNGLVERLRELEDARRQLLSNLIHELGRPIGALRAATHALRNGAADVPDLRDELLGGIDGELRRVQRLVDDLSQLQDRLLGTLELQREEVALGEWLPAVLRPWAESAQQKGLRWQVVLAPELPCLPVDPDRLGQALGNLLSNAIKYTPAGGLVTFTAGLAEGSLRLAVNDSGPGISAEEQERVFEPFYRSRAAGRFPQGMGLGLSIARDLVLAHGGQLSLESVSGKGSRFTIELPLDAQRLARAVRPVHP